MQSTPEPLDVVELLDQAEQVAGAVAVAVLERPHQHLVEDGALVPVRVALRLGQVGEVVDRVALGQDGVDVGGRLAHGVVPASAARPRALDPEHVGRLVERVQAHVVGLPPDVGLAADLVVHGHACRPTPSPAPACPAAPSSRGRRADRG